MKIYNEIILLWNEETQRFDVVSEDSFEHDGSVALARRRGRGGGRRGKAGSKNTGKKKTYLMVLLGFIG